MAAASEGNLENAFRIIIIGGGMAGLSAASHLVKNGITDFKLLEAKSIIGGRIEDIESGTNKMEMGASWIHGVLGNPIYEIAMTNCLIDIIHTPKPHRVIAARENGSQVPFPILQEIYEAYMCFLRRCEEYFLCQYLPPEGVSSVGEHIKLEASMYLDNVKNLHERQMRELVFECLLKRETCITGCNNMTDIELLELGSYTELQGGNISLPTGFTSILQPITALIPPRNILTNHAVALVKWQKKDSMEDHLASPGYDSGIDLLANGDQGNDSDDSDKTMTEGTPTPQKTSSSRASSEKSISKTDNSQLINEGITKLSQTSQDSMDKHNEIEIVCENGTKFYAEHVICAVPLGVLKEKGSTLFSPTLPQYKLDSIKRLSFGTVDKIYLEYSRPFLNADISEVMLLWETEDSSAEMSEVWFKKIYSFSKVTETLLLGWISGMEAEYMETLSENVVAEKCTQILRLFLNDPYIPLPKKCFCTNWYSQEHFRGSYTAIAVGSSQLDIEQIAQPLYSHTGQKKPSIVFAGEHTHSSFYSTVHGAYLTGRSAAQLLLTQESSQEIELTCDDTSDLSSWIQGISLN